MEGSGTTSMGRVAFASFIGTAIEFYDFYIYGTAAALAFATVFVPEGLAGSRVAQLLTYAGFAVAFVARPFGGAVLLATEHATRGRRGLYSSFPQMGPAAGSWWRTCCS